MSILILNRSSLERVPYAEILRDLDEPLYLISDGARLSRSDCEKYRAQFSRIEIVDDYEASGEVDFLAMELHRQLRFRRIIALAESDLLRAARLRDHLGIEGQGYESGLAFRDKIVMKEAVRAAGLRVPEARRVHEASDVLHFVAQRGLPVVVKPVMGSGAVNAHLIHDPETLREIVATISGSGAERPSVAYEIEELIAGDLYHVDGFVHDQRLLACWPSRYINSCPGLLQGTSLGGCLLDHDNPLVPQLHSFVERSLRALPTPPDCAFHAEVFRTPAGELVLCEIAARVGGSPIPSLWRSAFGIDLPSIFVRAQAGGLAPPRVPLDRPAQPSGFLMVPQVPGTLVSAPPRCPFPWVYEYELRGQPGKRYAGAKAVNEIIVSFVVQGGNEREIEQRIATANEWFKREVKWSHDPAEATCP